MRKLNEYLEGFIGLFYPNLCLVCHQNLSIKDETLFCFSCEVKLPQTNYHLEKENPFIERFWGRLPIQAAAALYFYSKGNRTQKLIYQLKYNGKKEIGLQVGQHYGRQLKESSLFKAIDLIVPVPLHRRKQLKRGYNQSDYFAQGLSHSMGIPLLKDGLKRTVFTKTQTKKEQMARFENVLKAFEVKQADKLKGKHILLVDDVLTTGATLEACATKILEVEGTRVSLVTIAMAQH